jgi:broad specificity phosphatase PhoE
MRTIDIRRHTMRRKPGAHLSQDGIALARLVGESAGPYDLVVTSTIPRAIETAIAMGFEVHQTLEDLGYLPGTITSTVGWPSPFAHVAEVVAADAPAAAFAHAQAQLWRQIADQLADGQRALIITHGLFIELGSVASLPDANFVLFGDAIGYCEGIRLTYDGDRAHGDILRVPLQHQLIEN